MQLRVAAQQFRIVMIARLTIGLHVKVVEAANF
jgi:hypothetical protein